MKKIIRCGTGFLIFSGICFSQYKNLPAAVTVFLFFCALTGAAFQDWNTKNISDRWVLAILLLAVCSVFTMQELTLAARATGMICVSVPMLVLTVLFPGTFGGGDVKLMAACGLFLGWRNSLLALVLAIWMGGIYGIGLLAVKKADRKTRIAFGPFLCAGMAVALLWGEEIFSIGIL